MKKILNFHYKFLTNQNLTSFIFSESLRDTEMMDRLSAEKFDIGISEFFDVCGHGIFKRIGLEKTIVLYASAMPLDDATFFGLPNSASFVYDFVSRNSLAGFWGRFQNYMGLLVGRYFMMKQFVGKAAEAYKVFDENLDYKVRRSFKKKS